MSTQTKPTARELSDHLKKRFAAEAIERAERRQFEWTPKPTKPKAAPVFTKKRITESRKPTPILPKWKQAVAVEPAVVPPTTPTPPVSAPVPIPNHYRRRFKVKWDLNRPRFILIGVNLFLNKCKQACDPQSADYQTYSLALSSLWDAFADVWEAERLANLAAQKDKEGIAALRLYK